MGTTGPDVHRSRPQTLVLELLAQLGQPTAQGIAGSGIRRVHLDRDLSVAHVDVDLHCAEVVRAEVQLYAVAPVRTTQQWRNGCEDLLVHRLRERELARSPDTGSASDARSR